MAKIMIKRPQKRKQLVDCGLLYIYVCAELFLEIEYYYTLYIYK